MSTKTSNTLFNPIWRAICQRNKHAKYSQPSFQELRPTAGNLLPINRKQLISEQEVAHKFVLLMSSLFLATFASVTLVQTINYLNINFLIKNTLHRTA